MGTTHCCSLPSNTPIKIKACFTRCDLENISYSDCDVKYQENVSFISSNPLYKPHLDFECDLKIGNTYNQFINKLSKIVSDHVEFNSFVLKMKYIRYETSYGLQVYTFKNNKNGNSVTFNDLFYDLSFVDWTSGYSLIIWFDAKCFKTNLDKAIQNRKIDKIYKLLQISSAFDNNDNNKEPVVTNNNYIKLEGEEEIYSDNDNDNDNDIDYYPFPIIEKDVLNLLGMDDELITKHLLKLNNNKISKINQRNIDFYLDSNSLLLCVEQCYDISRNMLIDYDLMCIFRLSPFFVIQWHATRYFLIIPYICTILII